MEERSKIEKYIDVEKKQLEKLKIIDTVEIQEKISSSEDINNKIRENIKKRSLNVELEKLRDESQSLSGELESITKNKNEMMEKAKFPIKGLSFDDNNVIFNNIPFDQASQGEKIKISTAMGLVLNPTLKILLIRDGSLLDAKNLEIVAKMAEKMDSQIWIERVGKGKECSVIISNGEIEKNA
jgi:hypothetical protein